MKNSDTTTPPSIPVQPLQPGNFDKAWNDPPLFSYSASSGHTPNASGGRLLNKRVGFPTNGPPPTGIDPTAPPRLNDAGAKPPTLCENLPPPPSITKTGNHSLHLSQSKDAASNELSLDEVKDLFTELAKTYIDPSKLENINKKLCIMFSAWGDEKLNEKIKFLLTQILIKLDSKETLEAERFYDVLSADYGGDLIGQWILAVRHLVTAVKSKSNVETNEDVLTKPL